jgi:predicted nucleic-acid-binding protein
MTQLVTLSRVMCWVWKNNAMKRIGLDTNVLIRLAVEDDGVQARIVRKLFDGLKPGDVFYVNLAVLLEAVWTLRRFYKYSQEECLMFVEALLEQRAIELNDHEVIGHALLDSRDTGSDFADAVIAQLNKHAGCDLTSTFDRGAARKVPGMELLQ